MTVEELFVEEFIGRTGYISLGRMALIGVDLSRIDFAHINTDGVDFEGSNLEESKGWTAAKLARARGLENARLDPGRYADAVAAGYRPSK